MKKLVDYKEEIHKCSKCGLCQSVCPVYKQTGNDCAVSRGKFIMLNGIIKGDLKLNKNINKYLDMCLKCNACKNFCPSDIDARKIFLAAKEEYFSKSLNSKFIRILNSKTYFNLFMNCVKLATSIYRFLKLDKFVKLFYPILKNFELGRKIILGNEFIHMPNRHAELVSASYQHTIMDRSRNKFGMTQQCLKVVYFTGCINEYINSRTKNAVENILKQMEVNILPANFNCCGVPFLSNGNVEQFIKQAEYNLSQIPDEFDFFLTDCVTCQDAFKEYENYIEDEKLLEKLKKINEKSINIVDFVVQNAKSFKFDRKISFTFHKPCHLQNMNFLNEFLSKAQNIDYIEMKNFDECCGFSGEFAIKNPQISQKISAQKIKNALGAKTDYIVTSCPACVLGLTQGAISEKILRHDFNILNFIELINMTKIDTY